MGDSKPPHLLVLQRLDVLGHLPLPITDMFNSVPKPSSAATLQSLVGHSSTLHEVQNLLKCTPMEGIIPRIHRAAQEQTDADIVIQALTRGEADLFNYTGPGAPASVHTPAHQIARGVDAHLVHYSHPAPASKPSRLAGDIDAHADQERLPERKRKLRGNCADTVIYEAPVSIDPAQTACGWLAPNQVCTAQEAHEVIGEVSLEQQLAAILEPAQHAARDEDGGDDTDEEEHGHHRQRHSGRSHRGRSHIISQVHLSASQLQLLSGLLLAARQQGTLPYVAPSLLQATLRVLYDLMGPGQQKLVPEDEADDSPELRSVHIALDAVIASLYILSSPGLPHEVYLDEVVERVIGVTKFTFGANVLALHDARWRRQYRPHLEEAEAEPAGGRAGGKGGRGRGRGRKSHVHDAGPRFTHELLHRLEQISSLVADLVAAVKLDPSSVLPLVRIMLGSLTVDGLTPVFHARAAALTAAIFRWMPDQRIAVLGEVLSSNGLLGHAAAAAASGPAGRGPARDFLAQEDPPVYISQSTALLLQLIGAAAEIPTIDSAMTDALDVCRMPQSWCDRFWAAIMDRLPSAKAGKSEGAGDLKAYLEHLLLDLLAVQHSLEWPSASLLLRRFVMAMNTGKGLQHPDANVRSICIDLMGMVITRIVADCKQAEVDQPLVDELLHELAARGQGVDASIFVGDEERERTEGLQRLMLGHLAAQPPNPTRASARILLAGQMLMQRIIFEQTIGAQAAHGSQPVHVEPAPTTKAKGRGKRKSEKEEPGPEDSSSDLKQGEMSTAQHLLVSYRGLHDAPPVLSYNHVAMAVARHEAASTDATNEGRSSGGSRQPAALLATAAKGPYSQGGSGLTAAHCAAISRCLLAASPLGKGRGQCLRWLMESSGSLGPSMARGTKDAAPVLGSAAALRSRAIKCLGAAIAADDRVLGMPDVQASVRSALGDDAVSVREAAVELLGQHIARNTGLAAQYFDVIGTATSDLGVSVRKRAVKVLWDCCLHCPDFPRATEAVALILSRAGDSEDSVRKLATNLCAGLWFGATGAGLAQTGDLGGDSEAAGEDAANISPATRAAQLTEVCGAVYAAEGVSIHLPLTADHPLIVVLRAILLPQVGGAGGASQANMAAAERQRVAACRAGASEVAQALLTRILELQDLIAANLEVVDAEGGAAGSDGLGQAHQAQRQASVANGGEGGDEGQSHAGVGAASCDDSVQGGASQAAPGGRDDARMRARRAAEAAEAAEMAEAELLRCLITLHALCVADVRVVGDACGRDPAHIIRGLMPALKAPQPSHKETEDHRRAAAEQLLAVLYCIEALLSRGLRTLEERVAIDLCTDLTTIINKHQYVSVVSGAVQCLCALAGLRPQIAGKEVCRLAAKCYTLLDRDLVAGTTGTSNMRGIYGKILFTLGQLCRYGCDILDGAASAGGSLSLPSTSSMPSMSAVTTVSTQAALNMFLAYYSLSSGPAAVFLRTRESALQAMGCLFTARPSLMLAVPEVLQLLEGALDPTSPVGFKHRVLTSLLELLRAEEEGLVTRQRMVEEGVEVGGAHTASAATKSGAPGSTLKSSKGKDREHVLPSGGLARRNGEGDVSSVCDAVMRRLWPLVLDLATDTGVVPGSEGQEAPTPGGSNILALVQGATTVRRRVLDVLEAMLRGGLAIPWQGVAPLFALATDPAVDTAQKALRVLRSCCEKDSYVDFVCGELANGVAKAHEFQVRLANANRLVNPQVQAADGQDLLSPLATEQLRQLWASVIAPNPKIKTRFMQCLMRPFEDATCVVGGAGMASGAAAADVGLLSFCAQFTAALPFKKADEPLTIMHQINSIVSRRGASAQAALQEAVHGTSPATIISNSNSAEPPTPGVSQRCPTPSAVPQATPARLAGPGQLPQHLQGDDAPSTAPKRPPALLLPPSAVRTPGTAAHRRARRLMPEVAQHVVACKAGLAISLLLLLKKYLREAYRLSDERVAAYAPSNILVRKQEEKMPVTKDDIIQLMLGVLDFTAPFLPKGSKAHKDLLVGVKFLLKEDAHNYRQAQENVAAAALDGIELGSPNGGEGGGAMAAALAAAATTGGRGRGRGRSGARGGGRGGRGAASTGVTKQKKRKRISMSDSEEEAGGDSGSDEDYEVAGSRAKTRSTVKGGKRGRGARRRLDPDAMSD